MQSRPRGQRQCKSSSPPRGSLWYGQEMWLGWPTGSSKSCTSTQKPPPHPALQALPSHGIVLTLRTNRKRECLVVYVTHVLACRYDLRVKAMEDEKSKNSLLSATNSPQLDQSTSSFLSKTSPPADLLQSMQSNYSNSPLSHKNPFQFTHPSQHLVVSPEDQERENLRRSYYGTDECAQLKLGQI